ncbi:MAG: Gfo/Idh/MocA family oxidoreductase [Verrucomicrobia bacterium]|nr:Gfo/Idh/MocA family oxidoreductase [Verrucomicrobiota bacterium]
MTSVISRRRFLKATAGAAFTLQVVPRHVLGGDGKIPPSRKLNIAAIGAGGQAAADLKNMADENIVALCDVDDQRAAEMFKKFPEAKRYKDFRKMLDEMDGKIDAVLVGTPDHTHTIAAMAAMKRGKHVYCEKPLAHSVGELRALRKMAKSRKLVTQVGNQGHSGDSIRLFCEWIWDGAIGNVTEVHAGCGIFRDIYCQINSLDQVLKERPPVPPELDWDLWQGPVAKRPYHPAYVPWKWRGWMAYGSGALGDWVCHVIDPVFWALDLDMPTSIVAETDGYDPVKHADLYPPGAQVTFEFPAKGKRGPVKLVWYDGQRPIPRPPELEADRKVGDVGAVVVGDRGKILYGSHGAGGCRLIPEKAMQAYKRPEPKIPRVRGGHQRDWLDAIRDGRQSGSPFEYGGRLSELGLLGVIAIRMAGKKLLYNERAMRFTNCPEATRLLNPPYHNGWKLA